MARRRMDALTKSRAVASAEGERLHRPIQRISSRHGCGLAARARFHARGDELPGRVTGEEGKGEEVGWLL
jgi:hypothetical protein